MTKQYVKAEYPLSDVTARIIAAAKEVHRELGPGFEEVIYQRALALELPAHDLEFSREVWIDVPYKGEKVGRKRVDFIIDEVVVEIKARAELEPVNFVQTLSYLKALGLQGGLALQPFDKLRTPLRCLEPGNQAAGELREMKALKH